MLHKKQRQLVKRTIRLSLCRFYTRYILQHTNLITVEFFLYYLRAIYNLLDMDPESIPPSTLLKGIFDAGSATPPTSGLSESNDLEPDEAVKHRISIVESRLLDLVRLQELKDGDEDDDSDRVRVIAPSPTTVLPIHQPHAYPCPDTYKSLPAHPSKWPQAPLMLRPTPNAAMKIRGIRYSGSDVYQKFPGVCAGCILPVNNGREAPGKALVIDFESQLFVGTLLMRVHGAASVGPDDESSEHDYFTGKKRKFQVVIKGRFRESVPMSECKTGQAFDRPAGKLPARLLVTSFIKFVSTLAPQLEVDLDGQSPRFLTPLVATAHTVLAKPHKHAHSTDKDDPKLVNFSIYAGSVSMEDEIEEPHSDDWHSVLHELDEGACPQAKKQSVTSRRATRKKMFNKIASEQADTPVFDTGKEYTFEFFQHLLVLTKPDDFVIHMGSRINVGLARSLNGQPIKIMSRYQDSVLWSFDLWHQSLYPYAEAALKTSS